MTTAERWYEYQQSYSRYGFDMGPKEEVGKKPLPKARSKVSARDRSRLLFLTVLAGVLCVAMIISTAYAAGIKYNINSITRANEELHGEIDNLEVKIQSASSIKIVEKRAVEELGMVYPTSDQYIYLGEEAPSEDIAMLILSKEQ